MKVFSYFIRILLNFVHKEKFVIEDFTFTTFCFLMKDFAYFIRISLNVVIKDLMIFIIK